MISDFKDLFSRRRLQEGDTSVSSCPSFTANWILLKWFVFILFHCYLILNLYSTGAGANTGTDRFTRQLLGMQRKPHANALMCARLMWSDNFSTVPGNLCQHIVRGWLGGQQNGQCGNRNLTGMLESRQWCRLMSWSIQINPKWVLIITKNSKKVHPKSKSMGIFQEVCF
jgi:hypothetical protein